MVSDDAVVQARVWGGEGGAGGAGGGGVGGGAAPLITLMDSQAVLVA